MITYTNILDIPAGVIRTDVMSCIDVSDAGLSFMESLGGNVYVIEASDEGSLELPRFDREEGFDIVALVPEVDPEYVFIVDITNNSGGPSYYIPFELREKFKVTDEMIKKYVNPEAD